MICSNHNILDEPISMSSVSRERGTYRTGHRHSIRSNERVGLKRVWLVDNA